MEGLLVDGAVPTDRDIGKSVEGLLVDGSM